MKKLLLVLAAAVITAPAASAGGWATVGLDSLPPSSLEPNQTWSVDMTVLQHGQTPLEGIAPVLTIRNGDGQTREFVGTPTGKPGVYHADVVFPSAGTWSYQVWDDFSRTHTFKPVEIGAPTESLPYLPLGVAAVLAVALAAGTIVLYRRRDHPQPAAVTNLKEAA